VAVQEQVGAALIRRCQQGDELAIEILVQRYQNYVYRLCYLVMHNQQDAEDMTQETFIRACRALPRFEIREGISFEAWLYRIAVNCCRSRMRRKWYQVVPWQRLGFGERLAANPEDRPERVVLRGEQRSQVLNAIDKLGEKHRLVIILRYYADLSSDEIAQVLNIPSGTVRSRLHTARRRLRELLAAAGLVPGGEEVAAGREAEPLVVEKLGTV
jgi:RNA polymerase sigma-70 factor (ECF subfamily)